MKKAIVKSGMLFVPATIMIASTLFLEWLSENKNLGVVDVKYLKSTFMFQIQIEKANQVILESAMKYINNNL